MIQRAIDQLLRHHLNARQSQREAVSAAVEMFETLLRTLSPILGHVGSHALFRRSLHLSEEDFPCYKEVRHADDDSLMKTIESCLRDQPDIAREASAALLKAFITLLATFIGERLAWQLLREASPDVLTPGSEDTQP